MRSDGITVHTVRRLTMLFDNRIDFNWVIAGSNPVGITNFVKKRMKIARGGVIGNSHIKAEVHITNTELKA